MILTESKNSGPAAHGDYIFGWKGDSLQKAMDKGCNLNKDCPSAGLTAQTPAQYNACTLKQQAPEPVDGCKFLFSSFSSFRFFLFLFFHLPFLGSALLLRVLS